MPSFLHTVLIVYLPLIIYAAGFIVCLTGYRRAQRKIYIYTPLSSLLSASSRVAGTYLSAVILFTPLMKLS